MASKKLKKTTYILLSIILIAILGIIFISHSVNPKEKITPTEFNTNSMISGNAIEGNPNASVTIVEFSDYECPFCQKFYQTTYQELKTKYIDTGSVNFVFRDFPLSFHKNSEKAAEAAECAGEQNKYYEMHNLLFGKGVVGGTTTFKEYAKEIGLNQEAFNACLDSGKMKKEIENDISDGKKLGVQGTPTFFINGKMIVGAQPINVFEEEIISALNKTN